MVPRIVWIGAAGGLLALVAAIGTFFLPIPITVRALLFLIFAGFFMASVVLFGRIIVMER